MSFFGKIKTRFKQVKYYMGAVLGCSLVYTAYITTDGPPVAQNDDKVEVMCLTGDTGSGYDVQRLVADKMKSEGCEEIRIAGDVIYETGVKNELDPLIAERFLDYYYDWAKRIVVALGNHDYYGNADAWIEIAKKYPKVIFPHNYYLYKTGDHCTIVFDSEAIDVGSKKRTKAQKKWLKDLDTTGCNELWAMSHHPYYSSGKHGDGSDEYQAFLEDYMFDKHPVTLFHAGHDHHVEWHPKKILGKVDQIISGAGGKQRVCKEVHEMCFCKMVEDECVATPGFLKYNTKTKEFTWVLLDE